MCSFNELHFCPCDLLLQTQLPFTPCKCACVCVSESAFDGLTFLNGSHACVTFVCQLLKPPSRGLRRGVSLLPNMSSFRIESRSPKAPNAQEDNTFWEMGV